MKERDNYIKAPHDLIIRYLDGFASLEEKKELLYWLKSSDENRDYFIQIRDLWLACDSAMATDAETHSPSFFRMAINRPSPRETPGMNR